MRRIIEYHLAYYDEIGCFDEDFYRPSDWELLTISLLDLGQENTYNNGDYRRLFAICDDGSRYEIKLLPVE